MPRQSAKQQIIAHLNRIIEHCAMHLLIAHVLGLGSGLDFQQLAFLYGCRALKYLLENSRYATRGIHRHTYKKRNPKFELYLQNEDDHADALTDAEFKFHFRLTRESFWELIDRIKDHPAFKRQSSDSRGPPPAPAKYQLLVLLKYYGSEGNSACSKALGTFFGVGVGRIDNYRNNALNALLSLEEETYFWPTVNEKKAIANRIKQKWYFPNCIGLIDGTLLPLGFRPLLHGENYLSRKRFYAIVMLVVCDDQARILYYHVGWPGSVHDNRVWRTCRLNTHSHEYFTRNEYLLGDSAFTPGQHIIPPFKNPTGGAMPSHETAFNSLLASPRVRSEHCIGILKGRLPFFKCIKLRLSSKHDMKQIIKYVKGGVILHNFLITEDIHQDWYSPDDDDSDDPLIPEANSSVNQENAARRDQLLVYLSEIEGTNIE